MLLRSQRAEIFTGLFVIVGLLVLGWLVFQFGDFGERNGPSYPLVVKVRDASGVREGVPVRFGGVEIGHVAADPELSEDFSGADIALAIDEGRRIPAGASVKVGTSGLMGDSFIRIDPPETATNEFLSEGDRIKAEPTASLNDLATSAGETFDKIGEAVEEMKSSLKNVDAVFAKLDQTVIDPENTDNLRVLLAELRQSSELIHAAAKKFEPVLDDTTTAMRDVSDAATSADETFTTLTDGVDDFTVTLEKIDPIAAELDSTLDDLRNTLAKANSLFTEIEHGDGLASVLIKDAGLKNDVQSFVDKIEDNGILFYPRDGGLFKSREEDERPTASAKPAEPEKKKNPFPWMKRRQ